MANARKCDRCGNLYEEYNTGNNNKKFNAIMPVNLDHKGQYYPHKVLDLCPECMTKLTNWLNCNEEGLDPERQKAVSAISAFIVYPDRSSLTTQFREYLKMARDALKRGERNEL